jgi:hypothetical protein
MPCMINRHFARRFYLFLVHFAIPFLFQLAVAIDRVDKHFIDRLYFFFLYFFLYLCFLFYYLPSFFYVSFLSLPSRSYFIFSSILSKTMDGIWTALLTRWRWMLPSLWINVGGRNDVCIVLHYYIAKTEKHKYANTKYFISTSGPCSLRSLARAA